MYVLPLYISNNRISPGCSSSRSSDNGSIPEGRTFVSLRAPSPRVKKERRNREGVRKLIPQTLYLSDAKDSLPLHRRISSSMMKNSRSSSAEAIRVMGHYVIGNRRDFWTEVSQTFPSLFNFARGAIALLFV